MKFADNTFLIIHPIVNNVPIPCELLPTATTPNSFVEVLNPKVMIFGDTGFGM